MVGREIRCKMERALRRGYSYNDIREYLCSYGVPRHEIDVALQYIEGAHVTRFTSTPLVAEKKRVSHLHAMGIVGILLSLLLFLPRLLSYLQ